MKIKNKGLLVIIILFVVSLLVFTFIKNWMLDDSIEACAVYHKKGNIKNITYYNFIFKVESKVYSASITEGQLNITSKERLRAMQCIKVKYSKLNPRVCEVVDVRLIHD